MFEDELIPLFEKCGTIWDLRLMMDPMTGTNRGYAFVTFTSRDAAQNAVREVNNFYSLRIHSSVLSIFSVYCIRIYEFSSIFSFHILNIFVIVSMSLNALSHSKNVAS